MAVTINGSTGVQLDDDDKQEFGTGDDLKIYHSATGNHSYITHSGAGKLEIASTGDDAYLKSSENVALMVNDTEIGVYVIKDGKVSLYYNNNEVFYTQEYGATVKRPSGGNTVFEIIGSEGNDAQLSMFADDGDDNNDKWKQIAGSGHFYLQNYGDGAWETNLRANSQWGIELYHNNNLRFETTGDGIQTNSSFQGITSPGVIHAKTGGGANNQVFVACTYNGTTFGGGLRRNGTSQGVELFDASDRRIKKNIAPMPAVLSKLNQIELKTYGYKDDDTASGIGPIAQDIANIFPEKVSKTDDGTGDDLPSDVKPWTVGNDFTWHLIKAVQELSAEVETLKTEKTKLQTDLTALTARVAALEAA